jgi:ribonuclease III
LEPLKTLIKSKQKIEKIIGYAFKNDKLFNQIFIHKSYYNENPSLTILHNERLEFLGDAVLGLIMADLLFELLPEVDEGVLSLHLSNLVNAKFCLYYIKKLKLQSYLILGKGESKSTNKGRETILADAFEALIAGIYLDSNLETVRFFFYEHFKLDVENYLKSPTVNYKADLQDYSQKKYQIHPIYHVVEEIGPAHERTFVIEVIVNKQVIGKGKGDSKKQAEQMAAKNAILKLKAKK